MRISPAIQIHKIFYISLVMPFTVKMSEARVASDKDRRAACPISSILLRQAVPLGTRGTAKGSQGQKSHLPNLLDPLETRGAPWHKRHSQGQPRIEEPPALPLQLTPQKREHKKEKWRFH